MVKDLVGNTVVLALGKFLKLSLAVTFPVRSTFNTSFAIVVLREPGAAGAETLDSDLVTWVLVLLPWLQMWCMVLWEVGEELWAVREAHGTIRPTKAVLGVQELCKHFEPIWLL
eukprot:CAMPEP_0197659358 /NCGR_PEP_ID=MMETSP1338-20131121/47401_1 /TAXON_ID=43686 ORGANISM="Pelagodinium beii, Strain RCC1491" /NCGR_SAMPLE_ID=MMETSP1338 /ASSEMBLY_ACC=CAM_ASM_000754 /LENGTH=113 /DNA_ID=CAMNT_0043236255 /DNA_START=98 /DNA_END=436 /DNA_ORIENTATION=-